MCAQRRTSRRALHNAIAKGHLQHCCWADSSCRRRSRSATSASAAGCCCHPRRTPARTRPDPPQPHRGRSQTCRSNPRSPSPYACSHRMHPPNRPRAPPAVEGGTLRCRRGCWCCPSTGCRLRERSVCSAGGNACHCCAGWGQAPGSIQARGRPHGCRRTASRSMGGSSRKEVRPRRTAAAGGPPGRHGRTVTRGPPGCMLHLGL